MYRIFPLLLLLLCVAPLAAAEATGDSSTLSVLIGVAIPIILALLWRFLGWAPKEKDLTPINADKSVDEARNFFIDHRLIPFLASTVEHWLTTHLVPQLLAGGETPWADRLDDLRAYARTRVIEKFAAENRDVVAFLGNSDELGDLVDRAVSRALSHLPDVLTKLIPKELLEGLRKQLQQSLRQLARD